MSFRFLIQEPFQLLAYAPDYDSITGFAAVRSPPIGWGERSRSLGFRGRFLLGRVRRERRAYGDGMLAKELCLEVGLQFELFGGFLLASLLL